MAAGVEARAPARRWLPVALVLHFLGGGLYLVVLPLWGAVPDEPLHYSAIKYDAEFLRQPVITDPRPWGEPLAVYAFTADPVGVGAQGPLYYWAGVPVFWLTRGLTVTGQWYALRVWTLLFSGLMIPLGWWILKRLFPRDPGLVITGTLVLTLLPHRLEYSAVIYNDIAAATTALGYLWLLLRAGGDQGTPRDWFFAGCALGLAFLAKRVALVLIPGSLVLLLLQQRRLSLPRRWALRAAAAWIAGALLVGGWWLARDLYLYGKPFPTEPGVEAGYRGWLEQWFALGPEQFFWKVRYILRGLWLSVWSQVGWVPLSIPDQHPLPAAAEHAWRALALGFYTLFGIGTLVTVAGFFAGWRDRWRGLSRETADALLAFFVIALGMIYGALHWVMLYSFHNNEETGKHAITIFVCLVALLAAAWRTFLGPRRAVLAMGLGVGLMLAFNLASLVSLTTYWIPNYRPPTPALAARRVRDLPSGRAPGIWHRYRVPGVEQEGGRVSKPSGPEEAWRG